MGKTVLDTPLGWLSSGILTETAARPRERTSLLKACALAVLVAVPLAACSLPYEQLSLPTSITGSIGAGNTGGAKRSGVPLSDPAAAATAEPRIYEGTANFTAPVADQAGAGPGGAAATSTSSGDGVTINLVGASAAEAAKTILGDVLGVTYIVSDKVKATITLQTAKPVDKNGLLEIFQAVLKTEGAVLVVEGGIYKIIPSGEASAAGAPLRNSGSAGSGVVGAATQIVPLNFVSAEEMERLLQSAAPQGSVKRVDSARNLLILSGTRTDLASMIEMVKTFDVDWMRGMSFGIFPVDTSDTDAIAQELDTIFANDTSSPTKGIVRFIPNRRLKSVLVITSRPEYMKKAETWIKRIDMASQATEKQVNVYRVQHRPAGELAVLLQKVYLSRDRDRAQATLGQPAQQSLTAGAQPPQLAFDVQGIPVPVAAAPAQGSQTQGVLPPDPDIGPSAGQGTAQTRVGDAAFPAATGALPGLADAAAKSAIGGGLPPEDRASGISIVADDANNSLVITASLAEFRRIRQILERIDLPLTQVVLEATIAEVTLNDELKFGLRWFFQRGPHTNQFQDTIFGAIGAATSPGFSYFFNLTDTKVVLNALSQITDVNVISSPSLTVQENKRAVLQVGDEVPIATQSAIGVVGAGAPIVNSISFRNTGVVLAITPRVSDDGRVLLDIEQEVSDAVATDTSDIDSPTIQQRKIKTTVTVNDGETVALAGMMQDRSSRGRDQVPILGDIPWIGNVFKTKNDSIRRTELLIAITPQVIRDTHQLHGIAAEYRDKLNLSTRPQRQAPPDRKEQIDRVLR